MDDLCPQSSFSRALLHMQAEPMIEFEPAAPKPPGKPKVVN
jgi:hypothetical protein